MLPYIVNGDIPVSNRIVSPYRRPQYRFCYAQFLFLKWCKLKSKYGVSSCTEHFEATSLTGLPKCVILQMQRVRKSERSCKTTTRPYVTSALQQLHWLPIHYTGMRIQYKLCLSMHSVCQQQCPVYISNCSVRRQFYSPPGSPIIHVPDVCRTNFRTRTELGERAFSVCGPVAWNALPVTIRNTTDSKLFKRLLKSHFYNCCFDITA